MTHHPFILPLPCPFLIFSHTQHPPGCCWGMGSFSTLAWCCCAPWTSSASLTERSVDAGAVFGSKDDRGGQVRSLRRCSPGRWAPLIHTSCPEPTRWTLEKVQDGPGDRHGNSATWTLPLTSVNIKQTFLLLTFSLKEARAPPWSQDNHGNIRDALWTRKGGAEWCALLLPGAHSPVKARKHLSWRVFSKDLKDS